MKLAVGAVIVVIAALIGAYAAFQWAFPSGTLRYRLTLEIEADGKVHSGSGVIEVRYEVPPRWLLGANRVVESVRGEAVTVDLGGRGVLCALLIGVRFGIPGGYVADAAAIPLRAFGLAPSAGAIEETTLKRLSSLSARSELPSSNLPMLVWFRDASDPRTVELVDPAELDARLGPGARLKRATIETTREAVTTGIERKLPWLLTRKGATGTITGAPLHTPNRPELNLNGSEFSKELFR